MSSLKRKCSTEFTKCVSTAERSVLTLDSSTFLFVRFAT